MRNLFFLERQESMAKIWIWIISILFTLTLHASNIETQSENDIQELYHKLSSNQNLTMEMRMDWISQQFLNKIYLLGALGEGASGRYDQFPLYRTDAFDCETYVDTVLALVLGNNLAEFQSWMLKIRYMNGKRGYLSRNHFPEIEWNTHNQERGLLVDITEQIGKSDTVFAKTIINKRGWYLKKPESAIRLRDSVPEKIQQRHQELVKKHTLFGEYPVSTPYLPLTLLFDENQQPRMQYLNQIPNFSLIEIVRPDWDIKAMAGTNLNISHMGFAVWKNGILYYRNASQILGKVADMPMTEYLRDTLKSPTIKGINVQRVVLTG